VGRVKGLTDAQLRDAYLQSLGSLAWFELYFSGQTIEADRLLGVIRAISDPQNQQTAVFIARMEGWLFLLQGNKPGEAKVKLSAAAEKDPFAALGLVRLYAEEDKAKARAEAQKLLSANGSGLLGAMLYHDLRELGAPHFPKKSGSDRGPPNLRQELAVPTSRDVGKILFRHARLALQQELIKDLVAGALRRRRAGHLLDEAIVGELLGKCEYTLGDAPFDVGHLLPGTSKICLRGLVLNGRPIANTVQLEIELDPVSAEGTHAVDYRSSTHL